MDFTMHPCLVEDSGIRDLQMDEALEDFDFFNPPADKLDCPLLHDMEDFVRR